MSWPRRGDLSSEPLRIDRAKIVLIFRLPLLLRVWRLRHERTARLIGKSPFTRDICGFLVGTCRLTNASVQVVGHAFEYRPGGERMGRGLQPRIILDDQPMRRAAQTAYRSKISFLVRAQIDATVRSGLPTTVNREIRSSESIGRRIRNKKGALGTPCQNGARPFPCPNSP